MAIPKQNIFKKLINERNSIYQRQEYGWRYSLKFKALIITLTVFISSVFYVFHFKKNDYYNTDTRIESGQIWDNPDLVASFTFPVYKSQQVHQKEIDAAKESALLVFSFEKQAKSATINKINNQISDLQKIAQNEETLISTDIPNDVINLFKDIPANEKSSFLRSLENELTSLINEIYERGFVSISLNNINHNLIKVRVSENKFFVLKKSDLFDINLISDYSRRYVLPKYSQKMSEIAEYFINSINLPNLVFSDALTNENRDIEGTKVPKTLKIIKEGTVIIKKGSEINDESKAAILSYQSASNMMNENVYTIFSFLGSFGHAALIITILMLYLFVMRKKIFHDNMQLLVICIIVLISAFISWLTVEIGTNYSLEYLVFVPAFVMLAAIVFDSRTAFYVTITLSFMLAGIRGSDYVIAITMIFSGILAAYTVRDIQNRTQIFQSIFFIFIGLMAPILIFGAERSIDWNIMLERIILALINAVFSPLLTFGMLFIIEKFSDTTTDLQLKEYDNLNHPLLQKMNEIAPGTYQHTLSVAMLAERAATAIGANPLLAKVGAYFHDIGKMAKAEYFTENQVDMDNKHELITPKKSVQIIKEHVTDGIVLANKYKLPPRIIDFIPMHHGTTLIKHFYAKALEDRSVDVNQHDYRYPGPKPNSKETAILMICDSAEAISRIVDKKIEEIEEIIEQNIQNRILDGQFDECNITMQDLKKIKEVLAKNLIGLSHQRTSYKEIPKDKENEKQ